MRHFHSLFKGVVQYNFKINKNIPDHYEIPRKKTATNKTATLLPKYSVEYTHFEQILTIRRYSPSTIKSYQAHFRAFLFYYNQIEPKNISQQQIIDYLLHIIKVKNIARGTQNQVLNAIKFYYEQVLKEPKKTYDLKHVKKAKRLPHILTEQEIVRLLHATENIKHKAILMLMYSGGLRIGEVVNLTINDIRSSQNCIFIRNGKGNKDRYTLLSSTLLEYLRKYYIIYKPKYWLFEGLYGGQYSKRSIQSVFRNAKIKSKVNPSATTHTLRHSFATHLVHSGMNLRYIQELLGHNSSKTTEIYTHIVKADLVKLQSPLDKLKL